ncbi:MAG: DUF4382 domain-containing protein [Pseudomonadota bacterium]|nr:DUF4382 domain-containing protein [Pseudomonadota bacterium]
MRGFSAGIAAIWLVGCTGEVDIYLVDESVEIPGGELEIRDFDLPFAAVEARMDGEWVMLARGPDPYNLLDFSGEPTDVDLVALREAPVRIAHDEVAVGPITALRLTLVPGEVLSVTTMDGVKHPLAVPQGAEGGWTVAAPMEIAGEAAAERTLDLRVRDALTVNEAGSWLFTPTLTLVEG